MKCFIILALLNVGGNLKKLLIISNQNLSRYKSRLPKKQIYMDEETLPSVLENERPTRLPNVC